MIAGKVEQKRVGKDVTLVELRSGGDTTPKALGANRVPVQAFEQKQARVRASEPGQQRRKSRFSAAGWPFKQNPIALPGSATNTVLAIVKKKKSG